MSADLRRRRLESLADKVASLDAELSDWLEESVEGAPLRKHHTQLRAIAQALRPSVATLTTRVAQSEQALADPVGLEQSILEVHRVWDFFRAKLGQRYIPRFTDFLAGADALAWACYEPAANQLPSPGREPPLVYLNGGWSPFTQPRHTQYEPEYTDGTPISAAAVKQALLALPVAVIGLPWFQLEHLPDLPIVGHEAGHDVEDDLGLGAVADAALGRALAGVPLQRRRAWLAWRGEAFADVYGVLATGPAFAGALADVLSAHPDIVAAERVDPSSPGIYPTRTLRVLLASEVLTAIGHPDEAQRRRDAWLDVHPTHAMEDFTGDLAAVAGALLEVGRPLLDFTPADQAAAASAAELLVNRATPRTQSVRVVVAAVRLAFETDPAAYRSSGAADLALAHIREIEGASTRAAGDGGPTEAERDERDGEIGARLADLLL